MAQALLLLLLGSFCLLVGTQEGMVSEVVGMRRQGKGREDREPVRLQMG